MFQLCDTNFPNGGFTQSFGFETYIQDHRIHNAETFSEWIEIFLKDQLVSSDGLGIRMVYEAIENEDLDRIWQIDRMLHVQNLARETREGTQHMGRSLSKIAEAIYETPIVELYNKKIKEKKAFGHSAVVYAIIGQHLNIPKKTTILLYLYNTIISFVQNGVRSIPLGQTDGQRIVYAFHPKLYAASEKVMALDEIEFGTIAPGVELAQMEHQWLNNRMFMS